MPIRLSSVQCSPGMKRAIFAALCMFAAVAAAKAQAPGPTAFQALHNFNHTGAPVTLVQGGDGNFYGVADLRQIFRVTPAGAITIWQPFHDDVSAATISLVRASNGELYGLVSRDSAARVYVFHLSSSGEVTTLHDFNSATEGSSPSLIAGSDGFLYGALGPVPTSDNSSRGALFKLSTAGVFSIIRRFGSGENTGYSPSSLIQANGGELYFVAPYGGSSGNGAIFKCTRGGVDDALQLYRRKRWQQA